LVARSCFARTGGGRRGYVERVGTRLRLLCRSYFVMNFVAVRLLTSFSLLLARAPCVGGERIHVNANDCRGDFGVPNVYPHPSTFIRDCANWPGEDALQAAVDSANPGDTLVLEQLDSSIVSDRLNHWTHYLWVGDYLAKTYNNGSMVHITKDITITSACFDAVRCGANRTGAYTFHRRRPMLCGGATRLIHDLEHQHSEEYVDISYLLRNDYSAEAMVKGLYEQTWLSNGNKTGSDSFPGWYQRVIQITNAVVRIEHVQISFGIHLFGSGMLISGGDVTVYNVLFQSNLAWFQPGGFEGGAAVLIRDGATVIFEDCHFFWNWVGNQKGKVNIRRGQNNFPPSYYDDLDSSPNAVVYEERYEEFVRNAQQFVNGAYGGAVRVLGSGTSVVFKNCRFENNFAAYGTSVAVGAGAAVRFEDCKFDRHVGNWPGFPHFLETPSVSEIYTESSELMTVANSQFKNVIDTYPMEASNDMSGSANVFVNSSFTRAPSFFVPIESFMGCVLDSLSSWSASTGHLGIPEILNSFLSALNGGTLSTTQLQSGLVTASQLCSKPERWLLVEGTEESFPLCAVPKYCGAGTFLNLTTTTCQISSPCSTAVSTEVVESPSTPAGPPTGLHIESQNAMLMFGNGPNCTIQLDAGKLVSSCQIMEPNSGRRLQEHAAEVSSLTTKVDALTAEIDALKAKIAMLEAAK